MKKLRAIVLIAVLASVSGCATTNKDPLEGVNRGIYKFNDVADRYAIKPVAKAYKAVAPSPVRTGISNFFSNLGTLTTIVNDLLQLKFAHAFTDAGRFVINTTFGLAGFIDVASMDKIEKHQEDFGQTLGYWGVGSGPYLVLPLIGPSTVRDASGLFVDTVTSDPITYLHNTGQIRAHNQVRAVQFLDKRTQLLDATDLVDNASIDPYAFMRDAFLQRRASMIQDGLVPQELLQDEFEPADEDKQNRTEQTPATGDALLLQSAAPIEGDEHVGNSPSPAEVVEVNQPAQLTPVADAVTEVVPETSLFTTQPQVDPAIHEEGPVVDNDAAAVFAGVDDTLLSLGIATAAH
ncbi:MlaA family lipoprotein [Methylophilus medardicus]|uniref:VacJ family lipoprotein n=1 Tax=Methylophilus medardicus TaxID=2588534 RepID=A0A5B8CR07_9PROT|nr:VacJ family lipoprotein [Methylophilus medardicus]QDC43714.1 VacJ family lipoprotein [Methylophilus medardicus]QDC48721.1 VacJ family lipoprotein [Methylophilus medardicus]QDC52426.1 VacJ family lipoprotein [Methylophilus medardicus]